jgi:hypothetical protein
MKMKKIIAREFLIFLGAIISFFLLFFSWNLYQINSWKKWSLLKNESTINPTDLEKRKVVLDTATEIRDSFFLSVSDEEKILYLSIFIFSIFFLARYLFYAVKWSIFQLKEK